MLTGCKAFPQSGTYHKQNLPRCVCLKASPRLEDCSAAVPLDLAHRTLPLVSTLAHAVGPSTHSNQHPSPAGTASDTHDTRDTR